MYLICKPFWLSPLNTGKKGAGDSAVQIKEEERLIFFKVEQVVFIMQHPDYLIPLKEQNTQSDIEVLIHYVGGQEFKFPKKQCMMRR